MRPINRRVFNLGLAASAASLGWSFTDMFRSQDNLLIGLGIRVPGALPFSGQMDHKSLLTIFNLTSRTWVQTELPIHGAHSIVATPSGYAVIGNRHHIGLLDHQFNFVRRVESDEKWEFGGHGVWHDPSKSLIVCKRPSRKHKSGVEGVVVAINDDCDLRPLGSSGGFDPHDMTLLSDGSIAIGNYGNKNLESLKNYQNLTPNLHIYNSTLQPTATIEMPALGSLSHFAEGPDGVIAALPAKLLSLDENALAIAQQAQQGKKLDLTTTEVVEGKVGLPSPILIYSEGKWHSFMIDPTLQRRPQSITWEPMSRSWFVTFAHSDTVASISASGQMRFVDAFDLGLSDVRGVTTTPNGEIYVSGRTKGLVQINPWSLRVIDRWKISFGESTHLSLVRSKSPSAS